MRRLHRVVVILVLPLFFFTCSDEPNRSPTIQVVAMPLTGFCPLAVQFIATATDPDGHSLTFSWDFGDGAGYSEMPKGAAKFDDCKIKLFNLWIENGAENN